MAFDAHQNLAVATIATAPSPATTGTSLTVAAGEGARFPVAPFNATVRPSSAIPTPVNAEIVRVTAVAADTLTIARTQEGTAARAIVPGDVIAETITAKTLTDIESGSFPTIQTVRVSPGTVDGADTSALQVAGGGVGFWDRGAFINLYGNEHAGLGSLGFYTGDHPQAGMTFSIAGNECGRIHHSGGLSWGGTVDPGATNLSAQGGFLEKGRAVPMGQWQDVPFNAANFVAKAPMVWTVGPAAVSRNRYTRIGHTLIWSLYLSWFSGSNVLSGSPSDTLYIALPAGLTADGPQMVSVDFSAGITGVPINGMYAPVGSVLSLVKVAGGNYLLSDIPGFIFNVTIAVNP